MRCEETTIRVTAIVLGFYDVVGASADAAGVRVDGAPLLERLYHAGERHLAYRFTETGHVLEGRGRRCAARMLVDRSADECAEALHACAGEMMKTQADVQPVFARAYRLVRAFAASGLAVSEDQIPFLPHEGMQVACARLASDAHAEARRWWYDVHYPDCTTVPGWKAVLSLEPLGREGREELTHMFLIDGDVDATQAAMNRCVLGWRASGRSPAPRGISKRIFSGPYARLA